MPRNKGLRSKVATGHVCCECLHWKREVLAVTLQPSTAKCQYKGDRNGSDKACEKFDSMPRRITNV